MNRAWLRTGIVVLLSLAAVGAARRALACTPVKALPPPTVVWPTAGAVLEEGGWLLFRHREPVAFLTTEGEPSQVELELQRVLSPLRPLTAPLGFFRPARPLVAGGHYTLVEGSGQRSVPFTVSADAPRVDATLRVSVRERTVPEDSLDSASCYSGPLADRPYTRVADVVVASVPDTRFVVSLDTLDSVTGALIEDAALHEEGEAAQLLLPMPLGVADCLRVRVWDLSGTIALDEGSLCVKPEGDEREVQARVFVPTTETPAEPDPPADEVGGAASEPEPPGSEPAPPTRASKGCELSNGPVNGASGAGIFGLGWLLLNRRRRSR